MQTKNGLNRTSRATGMEFKTKNFTIMKRIKITREGEFTGNWFNPESAILYVKENGYHDGSNFVSKATGYQFIHEALYYTKSGKFVLNHWSQWQGSTESYELMNERDVVDWIIKNEFDDLDFLDALPAKIKEFVLASIADAEI